MKSNVRYPRDLHERYHSERNAAGDTPAKHLNFDEWLDRDVPSRPPETKVYESENAATLWRDLSRLYEDFCGPDPEQWEDRKVRFQTVIGDIQVHLRDSCHEACRRTNE